MPNKFNGQLKEALLSAFNGAHPDGLASWVLQEAKANPTAGLALLGRLIPVSQKAHWTPLLPFVMSMKPRIKWSWCSRAGGRRSFSETPTSKGRQIDRICCVLRSHPARHS